MNTPLPDVLVSDDTRAVTPVLAFVLLFGIGVIAFSGYQAYQVPQQNQAVEFEHLQTVENDLVQVRAAVLRAGQSDVRELATVQLGTTYPTRLFAINPPPPSGTLQTSDRYDIQFESSSDLPTRFLKYEPGYNELPSSPVWYENSVLYREAGDDIIILEDQELVTDDGTLELTALQQEFREQGAGRVTVNFYPKQDRTGSTIEGDVTIPTRLDGEEYWDDALSDVGIYAGVDTGEDSPYPDGVNALGFENVSDINVNAVGIRDPPDDGLKQDVGPGDSSDDPPAGDVLADVRASNLTADPNTQEQEFAIDLGQDLNEGDLITIDLEADTEGITYSSGNKYEVTDGSGTISRNKQRGETVSLTYTAGANDNAGDTITITADKVQVDSTAGERRSIEASITGESETASFSILQDGQGRDSPGQGNGPPSDPPGRGSG